MSEIPAKTASLYDLLEQLRSELVGADQCLFSLLQDPQPECDTIAALPLERLSLIIDTQGLIVIAIQVYQRIQFLKELLGGRL